MLLRRGAVVLLLFWVIIILLFIELSVFVHSRDNCIDDDDGDDDDDYGILQEQFFPITKQTRHATTMR